MPTMLLQLLLLFSAAVTPEQEIRAVLSRQAVDWNRGDVRAFMNGYEKSDSLTFVGKTIARGHANVLANYLKNYPSKEKMGQLQFEIEEVRLLGTDYASVIGRWKLTRETASGGDTGRIFTLLFKKGPSGWRIILDHTT